MYFVIQIWSVVFGSFNLFLLSKIWARLDDQSIFIQLILNMAWQTFW